MLDRLANQSLGTLTRDRLDAQTRTQREPNLRDAQFGLQEMNQFLHFLRTGREFDTSVDVFGVLAKHRHADQV